MDNIPVFEKLRYRRHRPAHITQPATPLYTIVAMDKDKHTLSKQQNIEQQKVRIYTVLHAIPSGRVSSYGQVAKYAELPNGARLVGRILGRLPTDTKLPWHRVLKANGQIAFPPDSSHFKRQKNRLEAEGIIIINGKVNLAEFGWQL